MRSQLHNMEEDFLREHGFLSISARMKRIVEETTHSSRVLYKELDVDIEPNWYLVFRLLEKEGGLTIVEIANCLKFSHPTVVTLISKLKQRGYVESTVSETDSRRKPIKLTQKSIDKLPEFKKIWEAGELALKSLFKENTDFINELNFVEEQLNKRNFKERTKDFLNEQK